MHLFLTWSMTVSDDQRDVVRGWAESKHGSDLYQQLVGDVQHCQGVEHLTLAMTAWMSYRRLVPDVSDHADQPIQGSYLDDLDALSNDNNLGNSGKVAERMILALVRVLHSTRDQHQDLIAFIEAVLDCEPPLLHVLDGLSDEYLSRRVGGQSHTTAMAGLRQVRLVGAEDNEEDWVKISQPEELSGEELEDHVQNTEIEYVFSY